MRTYASQLYLKGEIYANPEINQLAVVRLLKTPLADIQHIASNELTVLTLVSSSTQMPKKYPYPQNTRLERHPKA
jgi:hypothetical protein